DHRLQCHRDLWLLRQRGRQGPDRAETPYFPRIRQGVSRYLRLASGQVLAHRSSRDLGDPGPTNPERALEGHSRGLNVLTLTLPAGWAASSAAHPTRPHLARTKTLQCTRYPKDCCNDRSAKPRPCRQREQLRRDRTRLPWTQLLADRPGAPRSADALPRRGGASAFHAAL